MQFVVHQYQDGTVDVTLHPDTKKTIRWNVALGAIGLAGFLYARKK